MKRSAIERLCEVTNLSLFSVAERGNIYQLRVEEFPIPYGFSIETEKQFSWIESRISFDTFSSSIIGEMENAASLMKEEFQQSIDSFASVNVDYSSFVKETSIRDSTAINHFSSRVYLDEMESFDEAIELSVSSIIVPLSMLIQNILGSSYLDNQDNPDDQPFPPEFDVEGRQIYQMSKTHERSRANRALAIQFHGTTCQVCSFNFEATYGSISKGYVEIHHLLPVSLMEIPAMVDPRSDLVPLCANCHRMVHRRWPPYSPAELRSFMDLETDI